MVHGRTFAECQDQPYYIGKFGETRKYTAAELLSDIKHGYVMLHNPTPNPTPDPTPNSSLPMPGTKARPLRRFGWGAAASLAG